VEALEDVDINVIIKQDGEPKLKTPNPRVELPYTYLMVLYIMHCPCLISAMHASEDFVSFVQRLERSRWQGWYMYAIRKII